VSATRHTWLGRAEALGRWIENAFLTVLLGALIAIAFAQIVLRNVFSLGLAWADGSTRVLVLWLAVIGAVAAARDGRHIAINLAGRLLPARFHRWTEALVDLFATALAGTLAWHAVRFVADSRAFGDVLLDDWAAWKLQIVMPIGFALITYRFALRLLRGLIGARRR
jgi:TRAP-type C4-dicarboxylate transport system permease small subunit